MKDTANTSFQKMVREDDRLRVFNDTVPAGILVINVDDGSVVFSNRFFFETLGASGEEVLGASWEDFFVDAEERQALMVQFIEQEEVRNFELKLKAADGSVVWGLASLSSIPLENEHLLMFAFIDITQLKEAEAKIQELANRDALTGLPSRRLFSDRIQKAMARAKRAETDMAVLFIDLDGFKAVNDTLGHEAGDEVLKEVSERLRGCIRKPDTAARIGGDEFIIIIEHQHAEGATTVGQRVVERINKPIKVQGGTADIGASVGIAFYPKDGETEDELMKAADKAMYKVKKGSKGAVGVA
ncbi:MAG: sensor domain-containing diguanylate cyclase [Rhodospirillales bacterium]|nr:sensor domain-containing diguanylate cyclase [Rhodospirillales bacterium]